ncbi:hypothetical protein [Actinoplanes subglobosus]|uniref:Uncharacterized protein n=1 Tax=Actinoplanes subglobosus TaxID=1547892 RepID=A0ABV8IUN7_9ACTN
MTRESPKTIHARAERAALELLSSRAAGIGEAAVLKHRLDVALRELDNINEQYVTALARLRDNGWSTDELHQLGLTEPLAATARAARRTPARPAPTPHTPEDVSRTAAAPGDAQPQHVTTA